ncbi:hypothetical protein IT412_02740 [Candidatus Peregrinibacteria bacterium]|nr:hypothetical protein [Candidatus Peregrinibacteria bacterium]
MDQITEKYQSTAQQQLDHSEAVFQAFQNKCNELKALIEKEISALDKTKPDYQNQVNLLKLKLKQDLDLVVKQFEKEIKRSFGKNLEALELIYKEKEKMRLQEIEQAVLTM